MTARQVRLVLIQGQIPLLEPLQARAARAQTSRLTPALLRCQCQSSGRAFPMSPFVLPELSLHVRVGANLKIHGARLSVQAVSIVDRPLQHPVPLVVCLLLAHLPAWKWRSRRGPSVYGVRRTSQSLAAARALSIFRQPHRQQLDPPN